MSGLTLTAGKMVEVRLLWPPAKRQCSVEVVAGPAREEAAIELRALFSDVL